MMVATETRPTTTRRFRAMGCPIEVTAVGCAQGRFEHDADEIESFAEEWEQRFSRFRTESELSLLNARAGAEPHRVSHELFAMVARAVRAARESGGMFSPLVLTAVKSAGYDRDFREIQRTGRPITPLLAHVPSIDAVTLDPRKRTIALPAGHGIDLGGIAKGAFVDAVVERYSSEWTGGCINAGGDLRVWGDPPDGAVWTSGIEHPLRPQLDLVQARFTNLAAVSAIATSGRNRRKWQTEHGTAHHLIDLETGSWVAGRIETATAFAADATSADLAAKTLFISVSKQELPVLGSASIGLTIDDRGFGTIWTTHGSDDIEIIPLIARTVETG
ncbi:FAD:protein FMN transferase [soil metagenome]